MGQAFYKEKSSIFILEYHSVCPLVGIWDPLPPIPQASERVGESQFGRPEYRLSTLSTLCFLYSQLRALVLTKVTRISLSFLNVGVTSCAAIQQKETCHKQNKSPHCGPHFFQDQCCKKLKNYVVYLLLHSLRFPTLYQILQQSNENYEIINEQFCCGSLEKV